LLHLSTLLFAFGVPTLMIGSKDQSLPTLRKSGARKPPGDSHQSVSYWSLKALDYTSLTRFASGLCKLCKWLCLKEFIAVWSGS